MIKIRTAEKKDGRKILETLKETDLYCPSVSLSNFRVAEEGKKIVGTAQFKKHKNYFFLSSVGVLPAYQKKGIASLMIKTLLKKAKKNIYLYTTIPDFFKRFGFEPAASHPALPPKDLLQCEECHPEKCIIMAKRPEALAEKK